MLSEAEYGCIDHTHLVIIDSKIRFQKESCIGALFFVSLHVADPDT